MDWQALTDKLKRMGVQVGTAKPLVPSTDKPQDISELLPGHETHTIYGSVFSSRHTYKLNYMHGKQTILPTNNLSKIASWAHAEFPEETKLENLVFLDTETTGLSGGTGTMAFMVGVARFMGGELVMEQFFLRNPAEETAMTAALSEFCHDIQGVVTYNGKSFDIPILNTRYILQCMQSPFVNLPHYDLLHLSRKVWRTRLEQCRLSDVEHHILGVKRDGNEIPGYLVPEFYTQYLRDKNAKPLVGAFYHNEVDVVSLAALFAYFADLLSDPVGWDSKEVQDITSVGRLIESMGDTRLAQAVYNRGYENDSPGDQRLVLLLRKAMLHKRIGEYGESLPLWEEACELGSADALLELAKYHEHISKQKDKALEISLRGLNFAVQNDTANRSALILAWEHRISRLRRICSPKERGEKTM